MQYGYILINEIPTGLKFDIYVCGLEPYSYHGFHVHYGNDITKGCDALGGHFNPTNQNHGNFNEFQAHFGDLGNLVADENGTVKKILISKFLSLSKKKSSIMNRSLILHADRDDLGQGGNKESLITGNSGKRIMCGVIRSIS